MLIDTHCHLDDEQFDEVRDAVVTRALDAGIDFMLTIGTTLESCKKTIEIAEQFASVKAAVGIQPNYCAEANDGDWEQIVELINHPEVIAIGETGLDRYWDYTPFEMQQDFFDRHLRLSQQTGLPFIVHMRECGDDIIKMLRRASESGPLNGVMHSFTGTVEQAQQCVELGMYISFAGMVTFKKSEDLRDVAASVPIDRILIETDAPYLSPHPHRGQRPNEPAMVIHTARCVAEQHAMDLSEFAVISTRNAKQLFAFGP
tara:strand:- start:405 stop:1181 length:777 start_codon:yes stop_codon:yes gene_type:complete